MTTLKAATADPLLEELERHSDWMLPMRLDIASSVALIVSAQLGLKQMRQAGTAQVTREVIDKLIAYMEKTGLREHAALLRRLDGVSPARPLSPSPPRSPTPALS